MAKIVKKIIESSASLKKPAAAKKTSPAKAVKNTASNSKKKTAAEKEIAVILLSGGMDSAVSLGVLLEKYEAAALHLNYGQLTENRELECFTSLCDHYGIKRRLIVDVGYLQQIGGSSLTDRKMIVPRANIGSKEVPNTYVPFRNAHILAIATSWAEVIGARKIFIGAVSEDSSGYPDTRPEFYEAFEKVIRTGTKAGGAIKIVTPVIKLSKAEIVRLGNKLKVPFVHTWSCYSGNEKACGVCDSCALRLRGFACAKSKDPIEYAENIFKSEIFV